jgi:hypothetical protein
VHVSGGATSANVAARPAGTGVLGPGGRIYPTTPGAGAAGAAARTYPVAATGGSASRATLGPSSARTGNVHVPGVPSVAGSNASGIGGAAGRSRPLGAGTAPPREALNGYRDALGVVRQRHQDWTASEQLAGGLVEYKAGPASAVARPGTPHGWEQLDQATARAGGDYSRRTFGIAQWFAANLKW